jgi:hypothetical protein
MYFPPRGKRNSTRIWFSFSEMSTSFTLIQMGYSIKEDFDELLTREV